MTAEKPDPTFADVLVTLGETTAAMVEAAAGYRAQAITAGFTPEGAEQMSVQYHGVLIAIFQGAVVKDLLRSAATPA